MIYKDKIECEIAAGKEYGYAVDVGEGWIIRPVLLSAEQVAKVLGCSVNTVHARVRLGCIPEPFHPPGRKAVRWTLKDIINL